MDRYLCIHGHFYQPPRENPWLEAIELQESAYPYHDWNERITDECYAANGRSRILDADGKIERIVNNYASMSFNFGPTLLSWLEEKRPDVYASILEADKQSAARFSGHGSAMAQGFGHIILPLSNPRDLRTQVIWGKRDFQKRFGRNPEGMWLPEAAVNTPSLEALAAEGIKFTVLAPRQAARFRAMGAEHWTDGSAIDPSRAYTQHLPSGRSISLFFYDGPVSQAVAFEGLLETGERFADRLVGGFDDARTWPQLMHIATDGETYGHHHRHGNMALAYALDHIERNGLAVLTNYAEFLERHPPDHEVQIVENSSWSCEHGVERWKSNCGCNSGKPGWHQNWRAPLRAALDGLRDAAEPLFGKTDLLIDPWAARDDYIDIILDRSPDSIERFFTRHGKGSLDDTRQVAALKLLEMQRQLLLMYTSCGWFFDELSGIETVQVTQYAGRAIQLAQEALGKDLEPGFLEQLQHAPSNLAERRSGREIYRDFVKPAFVDLNKLAGHYAITSTFEPFDEHARVYSYDAHREDAQMATAGRARLLVGHARFTSRITRESTHLAYGVLHLGDHILNAGVRAYGGDEWYTAALNKARETFNAADYPATLRDIDAAFGENRHTLATLFRDEQHRIVAKILDATLQEVGAAYRQVYEHHAPLLRFMAGIHIPPPRPLRVTAEIVLNSGITGALSLEKPDPDRARALLDEARDGGIRIDEPAVAYAAKLLLERQAADLAAQPMDINTLQRLHHTVALCSGLPFEVRLDAAQDQVYALLTSDNQASDPPDGWRELLSETARKLNLRIA